MFANYIKIALRHLLRNKGYTLINILGLAVGMACFLMIYLYVSNELGYDSFHQKADRIYRMALERMYPGRSTHYAIIPQSYAGSVKKDLPEVEASTRIFSFTGTWTFRIEDVLYDEAGGIFADSNFFDVFSFELLRGDQGKVLAEPNSVVLTESIAKKFFGTQDPIGKVLDNPQGNNDLMVTGICADPPENSHITFTMIGASKGLQFLQQPNHINFSAYTYLLLHPNTNPAEVEAKFPDLVTKYASGEVSRQFGVSYEEYQQAGNGYRYFLQPIEDIYLKSDLDNEMKAPGSITRVYIFTFIALFILIIACINFMNLATARSVERAKEVGIRKTLGSARWNIAIQFLIEATAISLISIVLAQVILHLALPFFNQLANKAFTVDQIMSWNTIPWYILLAVGVGLLAGSYPAFILSKFMPLQVLRGKLTATKHGSLLRNGLVIFQFSVSIMLIIGTLVVYTQLQYIQNKELGFNKEQLINLQGAFSLGPQGNETLKKQLLNLPGVASVSSCSAVPGQPFFGMSFKPVGDNEMVTGRGIIVDDNYFECMEMEMARGRAYAEDFEDSLSVVLNEAAVKELGLDDPLGATLVSNDNFLNPNSEEGDRPQYTIVGVVKDFHFQSLHQKITPLFFINEKVNNGVNGLISVRILPNSFQQTISEIEKFWLQNAPDQPFHFTFLDRDLAQLYEREQTAQKVSSLFSLLAIFIACMGLLGLAAYTTQQRTKEIGIRKVLGASVGNIVLLLSRNFLQLILIALPIASLIAWFSMESWLDSFAYRINISWWMFALAGVLVLIVAFGTVSLQSIRAALTNPIKSLRDE